MERALKMSHLLEGKILKCIFIGRGNARECAKDFHHYCVQRNYSTYGCDWSNNAHETHLSIYLLGAGSQLFSARRFGMANYNTKVEKIFSTATCGYSLTLPTDVYVPQLSTTKAHQFYAEIEHIYKGHDYVESMDDSLEMEPEVDRGRSYLIALLSPVTEEEDAIDGAGMSCIAPPNSPTLDEKLCRALNKGRKELKRLQKVKKEAVKIIEPVLD